MILVVVGLPASGKSTVAQILREEGFDVIELGDIWRELLKKNNVPINDPRATREFTLMIREKYGKDIYAKYALKKIKKSMRHIVIMGVRSTYEMDRIKKHIKDVKVIALLSPLKISYKRLRTRAKPEDPKNLSDFNWLVTREKRGFMSDKKEEKHGVMVLIKKSDFAISNVGTIDDLRASLNQVLVKIQTEE